MLDEDDNIETESNFGVVGMIWSSSEGKILTPRSKNSHKELDPNKLDEPF